LYLAKGNHCQCAVCSTDPSLGSVCLSVWRRSQKIGARGGQIFALFGAQCNVSRKRFGLGTVPTSPPLPPSLRRSSFHPSDPCCGCGCGGCCLLLFLCVSTHPTHPPSPSPALSEGLEGCVCGSALSNIAAAVVLVVAAHDCQQQNTAAVQFSSVQFSSAQLSSAQLSSAQLSSVQFSSAQLSSVQFSSPAGAVSLWHPLSCPPRPLRSVGQSAVLYSCANQPTNTARDTPLLSPPHHRHHFRPKSRVRVVRRSRPPPPTTTTTVTTTTVTTATATATTTRRQLLLSPPPRPPFFHRRQKRK
jgi:hypothetical protein